MATKQQTFDAVVSHLRKQGKKAIEESFGCCYRTDSGLKCAAGCLIPDDEYRPDFEGSAVWSDDRDVLSVSTCIRNLGHDIELVRDLQNVHDGIEVAEWEDQFKDIAKEHGLTYTPPVAQPEAAQ